MSAEEVRKELSKYARKIVSSGLVVGPGGNISARHGEFMYLSPSGYALEEIEPEQWIGVNIETREVAGAVKNTRPSSEVLMHLFCYQQNKTINALVHTHPPYCIALSLVSDKLPGLFPDQAALVGDIGFVDYVVPTTNVLAEAVAAKINQYCSLILVNHGLVTVGGNLREAFYRTQVVEESAKIYLAASAIRQPKELTEAELKEIQALDSETYRIQLLQQLK